VEKTRMMSRLSGAATIPYSVGFIRHAFSHGRVVLPRPFLFLKNGI